MAFSELKYCKFNNLITSVAHGDTYDKNSVTKWDYIMHPSHETLRIVSTCTHSITHAHNAKKGHWGKRWDFRLVLKVGREFQICTAEKKGTTTILFEGGNVKTYVIEKRMQRPRMDVDFYKFSQVLSGSTSH